MKTRGKGLRRLVGAEHGKVLILALIFLVLGALLLTPLLGLMNTGLTAGRVYENRAHSLYAADAGVEDAVNWLLEGRPDTWPWTDDADGPWERSQELEVNHHNVEVTIEVHGLSEDNKYKITSTSKAINGGGGTKVMALVMVQPRSKCQVLTGEQTFSNQIDAPPGVDIIVIGTVTIRHNQTLEGDMSIDGDLNLTNQAKINVEGGICVTETVRMENNTEINADGLLVGEDLEIGNNCDIYGYVLISGDITFSQNANSRINGNVYAYGDITINLGHPNSEILGTVYSTGTVTVVPADRIDNIESVEENHDEAGYPEPDCPQMDTQGTVVDTYQIEGYGA